MRSVLDEARGRARDGEVKIAWASDVHLDFLDREGGEELIVDRFARPLSTTDVDAVVISGDISLSESIVSHIRLLDDVLQRPVYFVLGNHDFYGGNFLDVTDSVAAACSDRPNLNFLTRATEASFVAPGVSIIGHDGWYDGYIGNPFTGGILMSDWVKIEDYAREGHVLQMGNGVNLSIPGILSLSRKRAFAAAEHVEALAVDAASGSDTVIIVTHVPPFVEAHAIGPKSSPPAIPWYTSRLMGDAILSVAQRYPKTRFEILCGHTHTECHARIAHNVACHVFPADYGNPSWAVLGVTI